MPTYAPRLLASDHVSFSPGPANECSVAMAAFADTQPMHGLGGRGLRPTGGLSPFGRGASSTQAGWG